MARAAAGPAGDALPVGARRGGARRGGGVVSGQPRVRHNDWSVIEVPALGAWEPRLSVSVVVPAYRSETLLPIVLAGLAAQTYPSHLLEVVVANDGPDDLELPEVRPERTRIVRVASGWGRANACHTGALASDGDVLHWLDADMLVEREHVEAQLRWHHAIDHAVVLGHKWFVDPEPVLAAGPAAVRAAVADGSVATYFEGRPREPHEWVEQTYERTDDLRSAGPRALRTHVGATASLRRSLYDAAGGMDTSLVLGEDIDLGHRLAEVGAVFVPDRSARSWHLGPSHVMTQRDRVNDHNDPYLADRVPDLRPKRRPGRLYTVPYLEVVLDTRGQPHEAVCTVVDAVLASTLADLSVVLLGDWDALTDERRSPLTEPLLETRLVHASYVGDPRVRFLAELPEGRCPAMFRMTLPGAGWAPRQLALAAMLMHLERTHHGLRQVHCPDGSVVRIERTAAVSRAHLVADPGEDLDDVVDELFGSWWLEAEDAGFVAVADMRRPRLPGIAGPPLDPAESWRELHERPHPQARPRPNPNAAKAGTSPRAPQSGPRPDPAPEPDPAGTDRASLLARARRRLHR
ncbi:glycosyltransferase [Nocardioides sp. zg-579]|uniref:4,4'-diaponeurosporenoate glycosyltransferase n=1 Tax=Nocardioides marmotae TaxID=2663857 RepID=A0A6I3JE99_9ACTN|nr:glycosyltransferase [Gordonia jinghuaiqii]MTB96375.1 glycosyltransferase [Nocardioides marmotae]